LGTWATSYVRSTEAELSVAARATVDCYLNVMYKFYSDFSELQI